MTDFNNSKSQALFVCTRKETLRGENQTSSPTTIPRKMREEKSHPNQAFDRIVGKTETGSVAGKWFKTNLC